MGPVGLRPWANVRDLGFSKTDQTVVQLAGSLPSREFSFNIFFANLFSTMPLFHALRLLDIGATGTARPNSREHPTELRFRIISRLVRGDVLAVLWQDKKGCRIPTPTNVLLAQYLHISLSREIKWVIGPPVRCAASRESLHSAGPYRYVIGRVSVFAHGGLDGRITRK
jgi:hypothetical protein